MVGPESAGANPGPLCYRKGGYATITDANLVLGRILPEYFPRIFGPEENQSLEYALAYEGLAELAELANEEARATANQNGTLDRWRPMSVEQVALGFVQVANETMCRPIRALTQVRTLNDIMDTDHPWRAAASAMSS